MLHKLCNAKIQTFSKLENKKVPFQALFNIWGIIIYHLTTTTRRIDNSPTRTM